MFNNNLINIMKRHFSFSFFKEKRAEGKIEKKRWPLVETIFLCINIVTLLLCYFLGLLAG